MENQEVFNTDMCGELVVNDAVQHSGHDTGQDDFERLHLP